VADPSLNTLYHLRHQTVSAPGAEKHGEGSNRHGAQGDDAVVSLPLGAVVTDADSGERIADLLTAGQRVLLAAGGNGGWGNQHFATPTRQAPRFAKPGPPRPERRPPVQLKLPPGVALLGFPNAGKSTLISVISAAKPKIADYPFTTLVPNLGVVSGDDPTETLVVADIPGLIEGAHQGAGLGIRFLKHVERCRLLCHLVDASGAGDAERDIAVLEEELAAFSPEVAARPRALVATKCDAVSDPDRKESIRLAAGRRGLPYFEISAVTRTGTKDLVHYFFRSLREASVESGRTLP
jgi:GTP-binding protein